MAQGDVGIYASQISGHLYSGPQGSMDALATVTVPTGGATSITISGIPQGYKNLQIRYSGYVSGDAFIQFNGDTAANYSRHSLYGGTASTAAAYGASAQSAIGFTYTASNTNPGSCIFDILDYSSTTKTKTTRGFNGDSQNGSGIIMLSSGNWRSKSAINSIYIYSSGFSQGSQFALYGVK